MMTKFKCLMAAVLATTGCTSPEIRSQSPESAAEPVERETMLVGDLARSYGLNYIKVEHVGLLTDLDGTGSDPPPSSQRAVVLAEMQRRNVKHAGEVLASPNTALVVVRGFLRPGMQKGDRFDIELRTPPRSETSSLRGGWLLETRLSELAVLDSQIRRGHLMALAAGPVLVDPPTGDDGDEQQLYETRGRVLGGGVALKSRDLGLVLHEENRSIRVSQQIGTALNRRFHTYVRGTKQGVATPKTDEFVLLLVHPRYKDNVARYMRVVRNVALDDSPARQLARLQLLERQLLDPVTAGTAAIRLEAIGKDGIEALTTGIMSDETEVRFYAAEAMAYLDQTAASKPLAEIARNEPAFRVHALAALSAMEDVEAHEQLRELLAAKSAETRYGAFRALWVMDPHDRAIAGEMIGGKFSYHVLDVEGDPMIHVTRSMRPELVLYGKNHAIRLPVVLEAGKHIIVRGDASGKLTVSRFEVGKPDQKRIIAPQVNDLVRAIVDLGGDYPDVVQALQQAKEFEALDSRLKVDALPELGRSFRRGGGSI